MLPRGSSYRSIVDICPEVDSAASIATSPPGRLIGSAFEVRIPFVETVTILSPGRTAPYINLEVLFIRPIKAIEKNIYYIYIYI